jgi:hypothetical protein
MKEIYRTADAGLRGVLTLSKQAAELITEVMGRDKTRQFYTC